MTYSLLKATPLLFGIILTAAPAMANTHDPHAGHKMPESSSTSKTAEHPGTTALKAANDKMHKDMMAAPYTDNTDVDFVRGMIPHHQGAVDMAKAVLAHGKDPEIRKLAEAIVKAQEEEIAFMNKWLQKQEKPKTP
jgi:uncharacterized protein (DUF305 family)